MIKIPLWYLSEVSKTILNSKLPSVVKRWIYFDLKMKEYITQIIYKGDVEEQKYGLKLINKLCNDKKIGEDIAYNDVLCNHLNGIVQNNSSNKDIIKYIEEINKTLEGVRKRRESKKEKKENKKQIMISYNKETRNICLQIKKC